MPKGLAKPEEKERAVELYFEEDLSRPPFSYEYRESRFERADERELFEIEKRIFNIVQMDLLPLPPAKLKEESPIIQGYNDVRKYSARLAVNVKTIKALTDPGMDSHYRDLNLSAFLAQHYHYKNLYMIALTSYLKMLRETKAYKNSNAVNDLFHESETVFIAHKIYTTVRSCTHQHRPLREDGDTTMKHLYEVSVAGINFFLKKLKSATNKKDRDHWYKLMKLVTIIGLCHDLKEDHRVIGSDNLYRKTGSFVELDWRNMGYLGENNQGKPNMNFFDRNKGLIKRVCVALTKPQDDNKKEGYITRQILNSGLKDIEVFLAALVKVLDRGSNIATLRYMRDRKKESKEARQNRKIDESKEVLTVGESVFERTQDEDFLAEVIHLGQTCINQSKRLETDYHDEVVAQDLETIILESRTKIQNQVEILTKKAA